MLYFTHLSRKNCPWRTWRTVTDLTLPVTDMTFAYKSQVRVTQNCDGPDRDGPDDTVSFSIITLNVDESWCPFWCIWTHKHIILQLPWLLTNNNTVFRNAIPFGHDRWIKVRTCHSEIKLDLWDLSSTQTHWNWHPNNRVSGGYTSEACVAVFLFLAINGAIQSAVTDMTQMSGTRKIEGKNAKFGLLLQTIEYFELWNMFRWPETNVGKYNQKYNHRHLNNIAIYYVS